MLIDQVASIKFVKLSGIKLNLILSTLHTQMFMNPLLIEKAEREKERKSEREKERDRDWERLQRGKRG